VQELNEAASSEKRTVSVLIDLDVGTNRTGVLPGDDVFRLAERIARSSNLRLEGICAYAGHSAHVVGFEARRASSTQAMSRALEMGSLLRKRGHETRLISGGSTGTYNIDSGMEGISELQAGSYIFMDVDYRRIGGQGGAVYDDFQPALHVLTTVIHRSAKKAIVDAGYKAFATDRKFGPELRDLPEIPYRFAGDEHGALVLENAPRDVALGERLEFIVPHCDPNVNLYDRIYGVRGDRVESVWSVMNRSLAPPGF
jgi:D-serine deaminase-like pyridoxal phosphate-dependent protein